MHYIIGPARNPKLEAIVECAQLALHEQHERTGTKLANMQVDTLHIRLLKLAAVLTRDAQRIRLYFASKWPSAATFAQAMRALNSAWHFILCLTSALTPTRPATQAGVGAIAPRRRPSHHKRASMGALDGRAGLDGLRNAVRGCTAQQR